MKNKNIHLIILISIVTAFMGQVYLNPFNSEFRVSLGIVLLSVFILRYKDINIIHLNIFAGLSVIFFRISLDFVSLSIPINKIILTHLPSLFFYIVFGLTLTFLDVRKYKKVPLILLIILSTCDMSSNIVEALIRYEFNKVSIIKMFYSLFITGIIRGSISLILYTSIKIYTFLTIKEEQNKHYKELLLFTTSVKTELFLLNKSKDNIEKAMEKAYSIYSQVEDISNNIDKEEILDLAKDIHEIKKDYHRVLSGIENTISFNQNLSNMELSQIFELIKDNTKKSIHSLNKKIDIHYKINYDLSTKYYYEIISIINNLISNSLDAIKKDGIINIVQYKMDDMIIFSIEDNGNGVKEEDINFLFNPGFTTKFDNKTGKMSTGIGLTHVKNIVEDILKGTIIVESTLNEGTKFIISIPFNILKESA